MREPPKRRTSVPMFPTARERTKHHLHAPSIVSSRHSFMRASVVPPTLSLASEPLTLPMCACQEARAATITETLHAKLACGRGARDTRHGTPRVVAYSHAWPGLGLHAEKEVNAERGAKVGPKRGAAGVVPAGGQA